MRFSTLSEWLDWLTRLHPSTIELGLDRVQRVWSAMADSLDDGVVVTIAGTNGKGSSVAYAEAILQAAGYRTGCYTSPHLQRYNERIRVDGVALDEDRICTAFDQVDRARGDVRLTYFEFGTLAALSVFAGAHIDVAILEVGLGGRLDAVNLIDADVALITGIALDHQEWLGSDREAIGREKAGIMRRGRPVVYAGPDIPVSVRQHAGMVDARLVVAGEDYRVRRGGQTWELQAGAGSRRALPLPAMRGDWQLDNAAGVLVALAQIGDRLAVDQRAARVGLLAARLPGRFDVRPGHPTWILDVAHNPAAAACLDAALGDYFCRGRRIAVCGMLGDKDVAGTVRALSGRFDRWEIVDLSDQPRGLAASRLQALASTSLETLPVGLHDDMPSCLDRVAASAGNEDVVVVFGSFVTVGAAMDWLDAKGHCDARPGGRDRYTSGSKRQP